MCSQTIDKKITFNYASTEPFQIGFNQNLFHLVAHLKHALPIYLILLPAFCNKPHSL